MTPATAHRLINDTEVKALLSSIRQEIYAEFATCKATDQESLIACRMKLEGVDWFQGRLNSLAHDFTRQIK